MSQELKFRITGDPTHYYRDPYWAKQEKTMQNPRVYFSFAGWDDVLREFSAEAGQPEPEFVYAIYNHPDYAGAAAVVFYQDGAWFHNSGSHCSCYGLEDSGWNPETFDPMDHFMALSQNKLILAIQDTEGEFPQATQEFFNLWLYEAFISTPGKD